ncbi:MAG: ABC transporter ATP-binding protein [Bacteroidota bacterium]|nr:ABC transporter ATP-binding protein [Bacteroidota bacterium]
MSIILEVNNLSKTYKNFKAIDDISFQVNKGDIYGFLGPNGAGKSTTLRMILGLIKPNSGEIKLNGSFINFKNKKYLNNIGALIERPDFYKNLSAYQNLKILYSMSRVNNPEIIHDVLHEVDLFDRKDDKVGSYSQGMKQRLGIAQTLLHNPQVIILDEPSNGLDPQGQADMRELILKINKDKGITVIISSHILAEIEKIANRMIVINKGQKIIEGDVGKLMSSESIKLSIKTNSNKEIKNFFNSRDIAYDSNDDLYTISWLENNIDQLVKELHDNNISIFEIKQLKTLEEYFLNLTN